MSARKIGLAAAVAFVACIVAANYVTTRYGLVPVGFGLTATAGTYFAGLSFVLRDTVQDTTTRRWVLGVILVGAGLSLLLAATVFEANPAFLPPGVTPMSIAVASGVAFVCSESSDFAVYAPLRERGYLRAAVASNIVGTVVDTLLFLWIAGFGLNREVVAGQFVGKLMVTLAVVALVVTVRSSRKVATA